MIINNYFFCITRPFNKIHGKAKIDEIMLISKPIILKVIPINGIKPKVFIIIDTIVKAEDINPNIKINNSFKILNLILNIFRTKIEYSLSRLLLNPNL